VAAVQLNRLWQLRHNTADPWPGGSKMIYKSGIFGDVSSAFMSLLKNFGVRTGIRTSEETQRGVHDYRVLSGP